MDAITAWSTLALALVSILSLWAAVWGIRRQTRSLQKSVSADIGLKLTDRFAVLRPIRIRATQALLEQKDYGDTDELFDFFDSVGLYVERGLLDVEIAHAFFFHWVNLYWVAGKVYIAKVREASAGIWDNFESLHERLLKIEMRQNPESRDINLSPERVRILLDAEIR